MAAVRKSFSVVSTSGPEDTPVMFTVIDRTWNRLTPFLLPSPFSSETLFIGGFARDKLWVYKRQEWQLSCPRVCAAAVPVRDFARGRGASGSLLFPQCEPFPVTIKAVRYRF